METGLQDLTDVDHQRSAYSHQLLSSHKCAELLLLLRLLGNDAVGAASNLSPSARQ